MLSFHQPCANGFGGPSISTPLLSATWDSLEQRIRTSSSEHVRKRTL